MNWDGVEYVVAVCNHPSGVFKKNDVLPFIAAKESPCICGYTVLDVGIRYGKHNGFCVYCNHNEVSQDIAWFHEKAFRPLDTDADISEITEHLENTKPFELVNYGKFIPELSDKKLIEYQRYLMDNIRRCKNGWLIYMEELWKELLLMVESTMQSRGIITTIKFQKP